MPEQNKTIEEMRAQIARIQRQIDHPLTPEDRKAVHRGTIARIEAEIRRTEAAPTIAQSREQVSRIQTARPENSPSFAPQSTPPVNPPTTPEKRESVAAAQPRPNTANSGSSRTLVPPRTSTGRASAEDLPIAYRALPGWFRLKFNEVIELEYTQKERYHLLPEFRTFQRAVEYYRSLCEYWNIDVTPADVDLSWSRMSEPNQEIRRRVWEEIVRHAKNPQP
jgi:hypothetical protein